MLSLKSFSQLLVCFSVTFSSVNCKCHMNIDRLDRTTPLLLVNKKITYPYEKTYTFGENQEIDLHCPGESNNILIDHEDVIKSSSVTLQCSKNGEFELVNDVIPTSYDLGQFSCSYKPEHVLKKVSQPMQFNLLCPGKTLASGFQVSQTSFLQVFELCYDTLRNRPIIAYEKVNPSYESKQYKRDAEFKFQEGPVLRNKNTDKAYKQQHNYFKNALSPSQSYFDILSSGVFFERGHLVPRADFVYLSEQEATYYFENTVPMWNSVNGGNWLGIESSVRSLSKVRKDRDMHVWTGTYGTLTLEDYDNVEIPMQLPTGRGASVNVPKYLYKLVFDETKNRAIVLVTINDPLRNLDPNDIKCTNVIDDVTWLESRFGDAPHHEDLYKNHLKGYTFACSYDDFKENFIGVVLPKLDQVELLSGL